MGGKSLLTLTRLISEKRNGNHLSNERRTLHLVVVVIGGARQGWWTNNGWFKSGLFPTDHTGTRGWFSRLSRLLSGAHSRRSAVISVAGVRVDVVVQRCQHRGSR